MDSSLVLSGFTIVFVVLWGGVTIGGILWLRWRRKTRWPFKDSEKLLRRPGESLKRQIAKMDEDFTLEFVASIVGALLILPLTGWISKWLGFTGWKSLLIVLAGPTGILAGSGWRVLRLWKKRTKYFLGWFAERVTAENLRPLQAKGYFVFHDVPAEPGKAAFNLDHVVVGPTGVCLIETKCRRKGKAREGLKDHEVIFDGRQLTWPTGEDRKSVEQAISEADWLWKWIYERLGLRIAVKAVVAVPGWYVREGPSPSVRVVNPKILPDVIRGRGERVLDDQQIDLITRLLDERCRDVAD